MIKHGLALSAALLVGTMAARAESTIAADSIKASASTVTVGSVTAEKDGYLVVHRTDFTGTLPGSVVGHAPVKAGQNADVAITLDKPAEVGSKLIVMLHEEGNNDTSFDSADKPAKAAGGIVQQVVTVQ
ncbi:hypothetical protein [uncultured Hyphomicrobium sp.]|uniref:DUF7282 domain-containing protein n=1 Tax=uncultured Hyphomicrobium sp. TaxID=194373 RepID=UPI0025FEE023|nr:hypothetical protein [uncultured Hyphomicrobium sp.]